MGLRSQSAAGRHSRRGSLSLSAAAFPPVSRLPVDYQAGDLLFFAGRDWLSRAISFRTCSWGQLFRAPFNGRFLPSHVGICCDYPQRLEAANNRSEPRIILVESTTLNDRPCFIRGEKTIGVQAHLPSVRVADYPGSAWRLRLRRPLNDWERSSLSWFLSTQIGQPYNYVRAAELAGWFARRINEAPAEGSWFCDELCIEALKAVGRVGADDDPEGFSPGTFAALVLKSGAYHPVRQIGSPSFKVK